MGEGTSGGQQQPGVGDRLNAAVDDLRKAAEEASGDARARIESALEQVRAASDQATSRAQEGLTAATERAQAAAGDLRGQLDQVREWVQGASSDLLDEVQKEIDRRREQLFGGDDSNGGSSGGSTSPAAGRPRPAPERYFFASRLSISPSTLLRALPACSCARTLRSSAGFRSLRRDLT